MTNEETLSRLKWDGWCVVEGVIPDDEVSTVRESVLATVKVAESATDPTRAMKVVRGSLINVDQSFAPYVSDPRIVRVAEALWGKHVKITITTTVVNFPGNRPAGWPSDWPFNQKHAAIVPAPYPDTPMLITVIFMLVDFTNENGGTLIVPGSHRIPSNWTSDFGENNLSPHPSQTQITGSAGSVLIFDSRMWHAVATNNSDQPRAAVTVRYGPWWLNVNPFVPGTPEREYMVDDKGEPEANVVYPVPLDVYDSLPEDAKPLFRHYVRG